MDSEQLRFLDEAWHRVIEEQSWTKTDRARLRSTVEQLRDERLPLSRVHSLLDALLSNRFLQENMEKTYNEHRQKLRNHVHLLEAILSRRREILSELKNYYLAEHQITLRDGGTVECKFTSSRSGRDLPTILGEYSYELVGGEFDRTPIVEIADDIERAMNSPGFIHELLKKSVQELVSLLKGGDLPEEQIRRLLTRLVDDLVMAGHSAAGLRHLTTTLTAPGSDPERIAKSLLLAAPAKWIVLASIDDIGLQDDKSVSIGDVTLRGVEHDFSSLCDDIRKTRIEDTSKDVELIKQTIKEVKGLRGKVTAEIATAAYSPSQATENAVQAISRMIDVLAIHDPNIVIREPREQPLHRMIVIDPHHGALAGTSVARRLEISMKKNLGEATIGSLERIVEAVDQLLEKNPSDLNEFERRILNAMHFYRKGTFAFDALDKVVNYFVTLESMLVMRGERPSSTLPLRVLEVLGVAKVNTKEVKGLVEEAYRHRGEILHLGRVEPDAARRVESSLFEVNRRVIGILADHLKNPRCDTLEHFLAVIRDEAVVERERMLKDALLEINRQYLGAGTLSAKDGAQIGEVTFSFKYSDDGRYIYVLGAITKFTPLRTLLEDVQLIDAKFEGISGDFKIELIKLLDRFALMELLTGRIKSVPFQARRLVRLDKSED